MRRIRFCNNENRFGIFLELLKMFNLRFKNRNPSDASPMYTGSCQVRFWSVKYDLQARSRVKRPNTISHSYDSANGSDTVPYPNPRGIIFRFLIIII